MFLLFLTESSQFANLKLAYLNFFVKMRKVKFQNGEYYHIYNRGVDKREVFMDDKDFIRFLRGMREFNNKSLHKQRIFIKNRNNGRELSSEASELSSRIVGLPKFLEVISYCLNSNHYHLLLKQKADNGIEKFMHKLGLGYTNYFNKKYSRSGSLFQGTYKAIHVKNYGHLLKLLVYVNCNYEVHNLGKAENWAWSSYLDSIRKRNGTLCDFGIIRENFKTVEEFKEFCDEVMPEIKINKKLQKYLLE